MERYICYYRVSTKSQGASGLGLESQKSASEAYIKSQGGFLLESYTDIESGKKSDRKELSKAIKSAKENRAILLIAKLDRLSRDVKFLFDIKSEVDRGVLMIKALDIPDFNTLTVGIFATMAQFERETISARTKAAFAAKRERGEKVGSPQNLDAAARAKGVEAIKEAARANENTNKAVSFAKALYKSGYKLQAIAAELQKAGLKTPRNKATWSRIQVKRLLDF